MVKWRIGLWEKPRGNRIWIELPFEHKDTLKAHVGGVRWDADEKCWHAALDWEVARDITKAAKSVGAGVTVVGKLAEWARKERERKANLPELLDFSRNDQLLPNTRRSHPSIVEAMESKPWQIPGAQFIADQRRVLVADKPGLGKTLQTLAALTENKVQGPILVTAPKSALDITWPEEIEQWLGTDEFVLRLGTNMSATERSNALRLIHTVKGRAWVLTGADYFRIEADVDDYGNFERDEKGKKIIRAVNHTVPELFSVNWSAVIVDESHKVTAGGSPGVGKRKWSAQRLGLDALQIVPGGMRIAISGTPFRGKTENLFGTLQWLAPDIYTSYWNWVRRHYGVADNHSDTFGSGLVKGDSVLDEKRFYAEIRPYMIRRTKEEVAPWLPPKTYGGTHLDPSDDTSPVGVWLPMTSAQAKQYKEIEKQALFTIDSMGTRVNVTGALAEMVRMKQVANSKLGKDVKPVVPSNKIDWILDFVHERQESGTKVIIASQFTQFLDLLSDVLAKKGYDHYTLTGKTTAKLRKANKKAFQSEDGHGIFLLNTVSGGTSLTLDAADDVVICDQTWIPDDQEQVEDRAHRISKIHRVTVWYLFSLGTIDEDIAELNNTREESILSIIDGQRGVSYAKQLIAATKKRMAA